MGHKERTLEWFKTKGGLTSKEAFEELGNTRLSATIKRLREEGYTIASVGEEGLNRFGEKTKYVRYFLVSKPSDYIHYHELQVDDIRGNK